MSRERRVFLTAEEIPLPTASGAEYHEGKPGANSDFWSILGLVGVILTYLFKVIVVTFGRDLFSEDRTVGAPLVDLLRPKLDFWISEPDCLLAVPPTLIAGPKVFLAVRRLNGGCLLVIGRFLRLC